MRWVLEIVGRMSHLQIFHFLLLVTLGATVLNLAVSLLNLFISTLGVKSSGERRALGFGDEPVAIVKKIGVNIKCLLQHHMERGFISF